MGARRDGAAAMKARATKESGDLARERQARPLPQRLDQVIHDRTRLAILAALAASETFPEPGFFRGDIDGARLIHEINQLGLDKQLAEPTGALAPFTMDGREADGATEYRTVMPMATMGAINAAIKQLMPRPAGT